MPWKLGFILFFSAVAFAQEAAPHHFWDRQQKVSFAVTTGIRVADFAVTCRNLRVGGQERWLPVQSCAGVAPFILGGQAAQTGFQYYLHRKGHHRLERWWPAVSVSSNVAGLSFTLAHWNDNLRQKSAPVPIVPTVCSTGVALECHVQ